MYFYFKTTQIFGNVIEKLSGRQRHISFEPAEFFMLQFIQFGVNVRKSRTSSVGGNCSQFFPSIDPSNANKRSILFSLAFYFVRIVRRKSEKENPNHHRISSSSIPRIRRFAGSIKIIIIIARSALESKATRRATNLTSLSPRCLLSHSHSSNPSGRHSKQRAPTYY